MDNHVGAAVSCLVGGPIARAVIDHDDVRELPQRPPHDVPDMFLFQIRGNDRGDGRAIDRAGVREFRHLQRTTGWKSAA